MFEPSSSDEPTIQSVQSGGTPTEPSLPKAAPPAVYSTRSYSTHRTAPPPPPMPARPVVPSRERARRRRRSGGLAEWAWVIVAVAIAAVVILSSLSIVVAVRANALPQEIIPTADIAAVLPTAVVANNAVSGSQLLAESLIMPDGSNIRLTPWDGRSRFTFVLAGLDRRPGERGLAYRTDSMMLISIDPVSQSIGVLSIPRDLYVQIPGYASLQRVNTPMVFGETRQPGYGPTLLMQTIQLNFGIRVHDYVLVDFQAFIDLIDAIGGIQVTTDYTINDRTFPDLAYGYDPFYLPAGTHQLNGYNALRFARTRHGDSDIARAQRQQQTLMAIRDRVLNFGQLPNLIGQAPVIWQSLSNNVYTGLTFEQMIQLALYVKDIPAENIRMGVINFDYLIPYTTPDGASVLVPNRAALGTLMVEVFGPSYTQ
jgi:LCP family protein required for cell wall assembly